MALALTNHFKRKELLKGTLTPGNLFKIEIVKFTGNFTLIYIYWLKVKSLLETSYNDLMQIVHDML